MGRTFWLLAATGLLLLAAFLVPSALQRGEAQLAQPTVAAGVCTPVDVAVFTDIRRIGVQCAEAQGSIIWYAMSPTDPDVDRVLSVLIGAITSGKKLGLVLDDNPADNPPGCLAQDCRKLVAAGILP
jgi:hypothetical protein